MSKTIFTHFFFWCLILGLAFTMNAQDLKTSAGTSNSVIIDGVSAILWDQTGNPGSNGSPSQFFPDFAGAGESADDFVVPAGETWTIDSIFIVGTYTAAGVYTDLDVNIFADDGTGLPGALAYSDLGIVDGVGPIFSIVLSTPAVLTEGTYWLNFMVNMDFTGNGQFFWSTSAVPQVGFFRVFRDSTDLFGTGSFFDWASTEGSGIGGGVDPDLQFALYGSVGAGGGGTLAFMDDFEGGSGNWDITNDGGTCVWAIFGLDTMGYTMPPDAMGSVFVADADDCGSGSTTLTTATMVTGVNASDWEFVWIEFDNDWRTISGSDEAYVEMSIDGGTTWTEVVSWIGVDNRTTHETWDVSATAGFQSDVRFRLRSVQPGWDWWWAIDNFAIYFDGFVPVELTSFAASVSDGEVILNWSTSTETNNQGFEVERNSGDGFQKIGFVAGFGTTTENHSYSYIDGSLQEGTYTYRLKQIDYDGTFEYSDVVEVDVTVPKVFSLDQNYPNPFNPSTQIRFSLAVDSKVSLTVFDILGQEVANLISSNLAAGSHEFNFDASNINSGVYFYRLNATGVDGTNFTSVKKMILTK
jgi:Secretion system C-terminal sorting domain